MIRKVAQSLLIFVLFLLIAEGASRVVEKILPDLESIPEQGWQAKFFATMMDWQEPDADYLWRFKSNLEGSLIRTNNEHLLGKPIAATKTPGHSRILLLGDSSPVGLGLSRRDQAFGEQLAYLLGVATRGQQEIELINAAVNGYTSEQIRRYLVDKGLSFDPDLVILYCGNNDASLSGAASDCELLQNQTLQQFGELLNNLAFYRLMRVTFRSVFHRSNVEADRLKVRVTPQRFGENLKVMADACGAANVPLIIVKPEVPLLWPAALQFRPFLGRRDTSGEILLPPAISELLQGEVAYTLHNVWLEELYGKADMFVRAVYQSAHSDSTSLEQAIVDYIARLQSTPDDPRLLNNLGVALWQKGEYDKAAANLHAARKNYMATIGSNPTLVALAGGTPILFNQGMTYLTETDNWSAELNDQSSLAWIYLDSAKEADYLSLRIKDDYLAVIDALADNKGVYILDLTDIFAANGGERLFIDHCHPQPEGHRLIATELVRVIIENSLMNRY